MYWFMIRILINKNHNNSRKKKVIRIKIKLPIKLFYIISLKKFKMQILFTDS